MGDRAGLGPALPEGGKEIKYCHEDKIPIFSKLGTDCFTRRTPILKPELAYTQNCEYGDSKTSVEGSNVKLDAKSVIPIDELNVSTSDKDSY